MINRNPTARPVERDPIRILEELEKQAQTHPIFARKAQEVNYEFSRLWLRQRAEKTAFSGLRGWRRLIPSVAQKAVYGHEKVILSAMELLRDVVVEEK
jgi:hypothetical protein